MGEALNETIAVETKALSIVDQARVVKIITVEDYTSAGWLWKQIGDMIKEVKDTFDPVCDATNKAHKAATEKRSKYLDPLQAAHKSVKGQMSDWDEEQKRIALAEQRRLEEIARKAEEERILLDAIAAEEEAKANGATAQEAAQEAAAIIEEPAYVAPIIVPKATPKLAGGPVFSTRWDFEIIDVEKIPRTYMVPDLVKIRQIVTALKDQSNIPGVKAFPKRV